MGRLRLLDALRAMGDKREAMVFLQKKHIYICICQKKVVILRVHYVR